MEINLELGKRFNPKAWPWENVQAMFTHKLKGAGVTFQEFRERGGQMYPPFEYRKFEKGLERRDGQPGFNTPSGKVELYSPILEQIGLDPLPYFEEPTESPFNTPALYQEYPLVLTTGARTWGSFNSEHRQIPSLRALRPDPIVEIHPETAAKYDLKDGDWVWIENRMGKVKCKAKVTPIIDPRVINADHAWWYPEKDSSEPSLNGMWDVNINRLVPWIPGRCGLGANYKSLLCKIYRVKEGEM
jgi:anaerobic selenocysteine-containing dehydrogenase